MSRRLHIDLDHSEGALLRVLGTVERRGFALLELNAGKPDAESYSLQLTLEGARDAEILCRQLERLIDVRAVRLLPELPEIPGEPGFSASWLES